MTFPKEIIDVAKIGRIIPKEIVNKILVYERYILMREHLPKFKYVLKDIEDGVKIILTDRDWRKRYSCRKANDVWSLEFQWKRGGWTQQPLEGAALYCGKGRIVCSKRVPEIMNKLTNHLCHPYYRSKFSDWIKPSRKEIKLINHEYFHR